MNIKLLVFLSAFQKLINSETAIYDVLQEFFFHSNEAVRRAALEVKFHVLSTFNQLIHKSIFLQLFSRMCHACWIRGLWKNMQGAVVFVLFGIFLFSFCYKLYISTNLLCPNLECGVDSVLKTRTFLTLTNSQTKQQDFIQLTCMWWTYQWPVISGVHQTGLHSLWDELYAAQSAGAWQVCGGLQVSASSIPSKQVSNFIFNAQTR